MSDTFAHIIKTVAAYEVEVSKAQYMFEAQTGLKLDKMTDFLMKFIYTENLDNRDVTMTILSNTTMTNENTIRTKLKALVKHNLIEICRCGGDGRTKKILPTKFLKDLMIIDVASKLKTVESLSENFKKSFGKMFAEFYKEYHLEGYKAFTEYQTYDFYKTDYKKGQQIFKNTRNKLG
jgi:hypothetical protein